jgi:hypothetical protein
MSPILYATGIALAFVYPWASIALYVLVALMWLVPDRRIEKRDQRELKPLRGRTQPFSSQAQARTTHW